MTGGEVKVQNQNSFRSLNVEVVVDNDYKTALKWYNKVLKRKPDEYNAIKNCVTLARKQGNTKLEKKYLKMMMEHGPEKDRMLAESRLKAIGR